MLLCNSCIQPLLARNLRSKRRVAFPKSSSLLLFPTDHDTPVRSLHGASFAIGQAMSKPNPRNRNGNARRKLTARLKAERRGCWICRAFGRPDRIDYDLPAGHPMCFEVDELKPVSRYREFGYASAQQCALDYRNVDATHRRCNQWKSNRSDDEVRAIASNTRRAKTKPLPQPFEDW